MSEFWKGEAIKDLQRFGTLEGAILNIREKIKMLEDSATSTSYGYSATPVHGGGTSQEDKLNNYIVRKSRLEALLAANQKDFEITGRVLNRISEQDRKILEKSYIHRRSDHIEWIMDTCAVSKTGAYELKNSALFNFTQRMYGVKK